MPSDFDNPRPLPPAKVRRATLMTATKPEVNNTPPPAYGSTFVFPSRNNSSSDFGNDSPSTPTRPLMTAWDNQNPSSGFAEEPAHPEDEDWMNEKSREELHELLLKAHGIIQEREQELGLATNIVKKVYDHNVVLKSKHEALLAKIPMSPSLSHSPSPDPMSKSRHVSYSVSESDPVKARTRKISIAMADISLLADQNAELLSKLQKLEEDSTAADIAGRRELKRLEKEIIYLRDALEKTQAKSEELEGKVKNAVASEAVRKKKEREAMRNAARNNKAEATVLDFAPPGSKFGGPSEHCSLLDLPKEENHSRPHNDLDSPDEVASDQVLITRLLNKVGELEEANTRILRQQMETANQLADVQQDAMNMTKVYELLSDHDAVQLELEQEDDSAIGKSSIADEAPTIRFRSLRRDMEDSMSQNGSFMFPATTHGTKPRKTVLGLFDEQGASVAKDEAKASDPNWIFCRRPSADFFAGVSQASTISSATSSSAGPLSPLHFSSPVLHSDQRHSEGRTLQNELESMFGQGIWNLSGPNHMRTASLSNLSQFSTPTIRSANSFNYILPDDERGLRTPTTQYECYSGLQTSRRTSEFPADNSLKLSVEPPTPGADTGPGQRTLAVQKRTSRLQNMSRTLRSRKGRWTERASYDSGQRNPILASSLKPREIPSQQILSCGNVDDPEGRKHSGSNGDDNMATPQALDCELDAQAIVNKGDEDQVTANRGFLFRAWLWFQFAIVVLIFIFAMARKGPSVVLGGAAGSGKERKAVVRR